MLEEKTHKHIAEIEAKLEKRGYHNQPCTVH